MKHKDLIKARIRFRERMQLGLDDLPRHVKEILIDYSKVIAAYEDLLETEHICPKCGINWRAEVNA